MARQRMSLRKSVSGHSNSVYAGIILVLLAFYLNLWNEGVGLTGVKSVSVAGVEVVIVANSPINLQNENKLVYTHGMAQSNVVMQDQMFGFAEKVLKLNRSVEMFQWQQRLKSKKDQPKSDIERVTDIYTYQPEWSATIIDSRTFKDSVGHQNPTIMPLNAIHGDVQSATLGDFKLSPEVLDGINDDVPVDLSNADVSMLQQQANIPVHHDGAYIFIGDDPKNPKVGEVRVSLSKVVPQEISVIAQQRNGALVPYPLADGKTIVLSSAGRVSPRELVNQGHLSHSILTWIIRVGTLIMALVGVFLAKPIFVDKIMTIPLVTKIGLPMVCVSLGLSIWALGLILAWFAVKPMWAVLLLVAMIVYYFLLYRIKTRVI